MDWKNHIYINLQSRKDRDINTQNEIKKLGVKPNHFPAIKCRSGIVGCALSHIKVIEIAKEKGLPYLCVFEDDIVIIDEIELMSKVDKLWSNGKDWDVLMLGGNNFKPFIEYDDYIKVNKCFTTTAYIIKSHYYDTWLMNLRKGVSMLMTTENRIFSLDMYNHELQRRDKWFLITPIQIYQRPDYSDIENRDVNYKNIMMNYDK